MENLQEKSIRSENEETSGFDIQAGLSWIYPTNYPLRDYQFNIVQQALYKNTLVCLPTGLGKTFIAAVVMYNFYRWYPTGKIVFMAPTKPLVKQQVDACYDIMAIPRDVTAELTGNQQIATRNEIWTERRVFFVTPQVLQNDLDSFAELGASIKCIVFDEAHKAKGNYAYCEVMRKLQQKSNNFRVLALSATPGNNIDDVGEVIRTLAISHMEFRTDDSEDVKPYVFERKLETIVVPLTDKLEQVKEDYTQILEKYVRTLIKYKIIHGNCGTLTRGRIFMIKKEFQARNNRHPNYNEVMKTLNICITLYHAYELLIKHGLRGFLSFYEGHINQPLLRGKVDLIRIIEDVQDYLGPLPNVDPLPDGTYPEVPPNIKFGHPKFYKLRDILLSHFNTKDDTKVIVFFEYRDSVMEAFLALLQARPVIRAKIFLGQKSGITQRVQLNVIKSFREGSCNTLLSTCIGEEGLDVGEVDLIVCFDISNKSPIRMVQRMGRTGRKREGRVVVLVTAGLEQQTLNDCLYQKNNMKNWAGSGGIMRRFFVESPRMVPRNIVPECVKMNIVVRRPDGNKRNNLKDMLKSLSGECPPAVFDDIEVVEIQERIPECLNLFDKPLSFIEKHDFTPSFDKYMEKQRITQGNAKIKSSSDTNLLVDLLKYADSKRFNIPLTQYGKPCDKNLKQGDIRSMFTKANKKETPPPSQNFITQKPTQHTENLTQIVADLDELYRDLYVEIANYLTIDLTINKKCEICSELFECNVRTVENEAFPMETLLSWEIPDFDYNEITPEKLEMYEKSSSNDVDDSIFQSIDLSAFKLAEKSFKFDAPKSFAKILNVYNNEENNLLEFFKLDKLADIYEDLDETIICTSSEYDNFENCPLSPVLTSQITQRPKISKIREKSTSPVLTGRKRRILEKSLDCERGIEEDKSVGVGESFPDSPAMKGMDKKTILEKSLKCRRRIGEDNSGGIGENFPDSPAMKGGLKEVVEKEEIMEKSLNYGKQIEGDNSVGIWENFPDFPSTKEGVEKEIHQISMNLSFEEIEENVGMVKTKMNNNELGDNKRIGGEKIDGKILDHVENSSDPKKNSIKKILPEKESRKTTKITDKKIVEKTKELNEMKENETSDEENLLGIYGKRTQRKITETLQIDDFCDLSAFGLDQNTQENHRKIPEFTSQKENSKLVDICDISTFGLSQNDTLNFHNFHRHLSEENISTQREPDVKINVIDLTDSPEKPQKRKILSQMSITQILSLVGTTTQKKSPFKPPRTPIKHSKEKGEKLKEKGEKSQRKLDVKNDSDDEFEDTSNVCSLNKTIRNFPPPNTKKIAKNKNHCEFVELEAEVSIDENPVSSDEEFEDGPYDQSFVDDDTRNVAHDTQTHAIYLRTLKSPRNQKFKIPRTIRPITADLFSQPQNSEDNTYINDSFCVNTQNVESQSHDLSELEILELKLKKMRKNKRKRVEDKARENKRKRILIASDDSE